MRNKTKPVVRKSKDVLKLNNWRFCLKIQGTSLPPQVGGGVEGVTSKRGGDKSEGGVASQRGDDTGGNILTCHLTGWG